MSTTAYLRNRAPTRRPSHADSDKLATETVTTPLTDDISVEIPDDFEFEKGTVLEVAMADDEPKWLRNQYPFLDIPSIRLDDDFGAIVIEPKTPVEVSKGTRITIRLT
jgi:hypothetical protein